MNERQTRILYLDILNILACFAVLMLHHNGIVHNYDIHTSAWKQALAFEVFFIGQFLFSLCLQGQH